MPSLEQLGENAILERLLTALPSNESLIVGPGDDCAVVVRDSEWDSLLKTDVIVENIHFFPDTPPHLIGRKALARALSDIAAMGGTPEHALITLLAHKSRKFEDIKAVYQGISQLAEEWNVSIAGGETSSLPYDGLIINVSMQGKVPKGKAVLRSTAQPDDLIAVTGFLGDSLNTNHHLTFTPRITEGNMLRETGIATAMMDISDGLIIDLKRLSHLSQVNFILNDDSLPCRNGCSHHSAMNDGEDYELLFTLNPRDLSSLQQLNKNQQLHYTRFSVIGRITQFPLQHESHSQDGWQHFNE